MKTLTKFLIPVAVVCLFSSAALGQQKTVRKARKPSAPKLICTLAAVPKGMVVIGFQENSACTEGLELVVKRPDDAEIVCAKSPVPDGYHVSSMQGSVSCVSVNSNPLTNALLIVREGADASSSTVANTAPRREPPSSDSDITIRVSRDSRNDDEGMPRSPLEQRAAKLNKEAQIENAANRGDIMVGMTKAQVFKAWGKMQDVRKKTRSGSGTETIWVYRRGEQEVWLFFNDSEVLTRYVWDH